MRRLVVVTALAALAIPYSAAVPAAADYEYTAESPGCGYLRFYPPRTGRSGWLPDSHTVRGPAGALFGRTIGAVKDQLVWWTVPMSDGARVQVHRRVLPALRQVEENLSAEAGEGRNYPVLSAYTSAYYARTSTAHDGVSYHALGAAIDINSIWNPYREDGKLITNIPAWFAQAWEDAGMCWGGSWNHVKDAMHFSWAGPKATPAYGGLPAPVPPLTTARPFDVQVGEHEVVFGPADYPRFVSEVSGDGAPDVIQIRPWGDDAVLEAALSRGGFAACGVWRWWLEDPPAGRPQLVDVTGSGRPDLVYLDTSRANVILARLAAAAGYERSADIVTGVSTAQDRFMAFGDIDGDGSDDLVALEQVAAGLAIEVWSGASSYKTLVDQGLVEGVDLGDDARVALADRTVDGRDDLLVVTPSVGSSTVTVVSATNLSAVAEVTRGPRLSPNDVVGVEDYDGDGRPDLVALAADAGLQAWLGNSPLGGSASAWFVADDFECPEDTIPYHHDGQFADDDDSEFQADIEWLSGRDVTRGCNPPFQDRFCPNDAVTRGQMAAFLNRALGLAAGVNAFADDDGSVFEADIGALAAAGITRGCNPPANDRFCPDDEVTRGQMAAFLNRALGLAAGANTYVDDDGSVFEADIGALAAAGITRGCNPPSSDEFCPDHSVTRGEMAAFLHRAQAWLADA